MANRSIISKQTRMNWLIDAALFAAALVASLTGIYFLFLPSGGYQGGRNPTYGMTLFFSRHTWSDLHTWSGLLMVGVALIHLVWHWTWVERMGRKMIDGLLLRGLKLNRAARINLALNAMVALSFLVTAVSGLYFLLPSGGGNPAWDPGFLFSRTTWDLIHTWGGIVMIVAAVLHLAIHWRWVTNVTAKFFKSLWFRPEQPRAAVAPAESS